MNRSVGSRMAAIAGGLGLVALIGCGGEPSVASRSAAAFREALKRGETFGGAGHAHGHGATTPGAGHAAAEHEAGGGGQIAGAEQAHGAAPAAGEHGGHSPAGQGPMTQGHAGHEGGGTGPQHAGHATSQQSPGAGGQAPAGGHAGHAMPATPPASGAHAGHAAAGNAPAAAVAPLPISIAAEPGQPADTLQTDALDAPVATSVAEASRTAAAAGRLGGDHGHGTGTYRQRDAGRGPESTAPTEREPDQPPPAAHDHEDDGREDG